MNDAVVDNAARHRFELSFGDGPPAVAYYKIEDGRVVLLHTEVPQKYSGQGIGSRLARGVFEIIRGRGQRVVAKCSFMAHFASRHPEYAAMLDG